MLSVQETIARKPDLTSQGTSLLPHIRKPVIIPELDARQEKHQGQKQGIWLVKGGISGMLA